MNRKTSVSVLAALTGLFIYSSCSKIDTTDLGSELIPAVDNVHTFETILDVETDNFRYPDTTRIFTSDYHALGIIEDDPVFGRTEAAMYAAFNPSVYGTHPFPVQDSVVIDSIVLSLRFSALYGDSNALEKFEVYQIAPTTAFTDSAYQISVADFATTPTSLGSKEVDFKTLNDSVTYVESATDTVRTSHELRIRLDTAFGRTFVNYDTTNHYKSDSAFKTYFKGLAIKTNGGASYIKNALAYFDLTNTTNTKLTFYTRVTNNGVIDTTTTTFSYTNRAHANTIRRTDAHDYLTYLNNGNPKDDKVFIQSAPGSYATVKVPGLDTFSTTNRVIHRAELIIEKVPSTLDNIYAPPGTLFLDAINGAGDSTFTIRNDFIPSTTTPGAYDVASFGGTYSKEKYIFNLSRYVQSIVTKKQPYYTLRIYAPLYTRPYYQAPTGVASVYPYPLYVNEPVAAGRLVAGGGNAATGKMRVRIIYSKI